MPLYARGMEGAGLRRLRWRLRGAWMWPAFLVLTPLDALLLHAFPVQGEETGLVPALLVAAFLNLVAIAAGAPALGALVRRRRPDLPRLVARDYAGTVLVVLVSLGLGVAGAAHSGAVERGRDAVAARDRAVRRYVLASAPVYHAGLGRTDTVRIDRDLWRTCVPGRTARGRLCLYVDTSHSPPGVRVDPSPSPNSTLRDSAYP